LGSPLEYREVGWGVVAPLNSFWCGEKRKIFFAEGDTLENSEGSHRLEGK